MIRAAKAGRAPVRLGDHGRGVMTADVEEAAQHAIVPANDDHRLASDLTGDELAGLTHLIDAARHMPRPAEDRAAFQIHDARVDVPARGNGRSLRERRSAW